MRIGTTSWLFVIFILIASCSKEKSFERSKEVDLGTLVLVFEHSVKTTSLDFNTQYTNDWGETFSVSSFRYYIHDVNLHIEAGSAQYISSEYYLIKHEDLASRTLSFNVPTGSYSAILFTLGVDSADNVSGTQTGALDPMNGMYSTSASGYVMAKLEGVSSYSTGVDNAFTYNIGGYKSPNNTIKLIGLSIGPSESLIIKKNNTTTININADINTWFSRIHQVTIADNATCDAPGTLAKQIADNYEGMFSIKSIK